MQRYLRRPNQSVVAVQLALETEGFIYQKWEGVQRCKAGDYLVENQGEVYTVDQQVFERTYRKIGPGQYVKTTRIWAVRAETAGAVSTKEGVTRYEAGDYVVSNDKDGSDRYAIRAELFVAMYELDVEGDA